MPLPPPPRPASGPRRRTLLVSVAGATLLGCSGGPKPDPPDPRAAAADRELTRAARDSRTLVARYDAVLAAHPELDARLRPLRDETARHAAELGPPRSPASGEPTTVAASDDPNSSLAELVAAERALTDRRFAALPDLPGEQARLLASVAAAGAVHAYLLTDGETKS
ncbi:hypothetical protein AAH978_16870 [Streptomyces sp. ZYX-F-203]